MGIVLTGMDDLQRKLEKLQDKMQKNIVKDAIKETVTEILLPAVESRVPVLTGALKAGLKVKAAGGRGKIGYKVFDSDYKGDQFYGSFSELSTKHEPAKPWLRPSLDENEGRILEAVKNKIGIGIDEAIK